MLLQSALDWHADAFWHGKFDQLVSRYADVMPVFLAGRTMLIDGHDMLRQELKTHREQVRDQGATRFQAKLIDGERLPEGRYSFVANWQYGFDDGRKPVTAEARYFCRRGADGPSVVEMIDYTQLAFHQARHWHDILPAMPATHPGQGRFLH